MFAVNNYLRLIMRSICALLVSMLGVGYSLGLSFDFQGCYYNSSSCVAYCFYDSTRKVGATEFIDKVPNYDIYLARNEFEACQIVLRSKLNSTHREYNITFSPFTNENGDTLESEVYLEKYIVCDSDKYYGKYPDALVPFASPQKMRLAYAKNWPFYIQVHADENTKAGTYSATVTVTNCGEEDKLELEAEITATVWDFTLPVTPSSDTAFGLNRSSIQKMHNANDDQTQVLYEKYYEFLLSRKISPYDLPYDILDSRADAYMSDPRLKSFTIPYSEDDELLVKYYNKVQSNPEWAKKGYFYPIDEPNSLEEYATYNEMTDRLKRLCPGYNMVTPTSWGFEENGETYYTSDLQSGRSNIVCGISNSFDSDVFLNQMDKMRDDGAKIWWYVCCGPKDDYCNVFIHWEGIKARLLLWQQKSLNIEGLLYWNTTYWDAVISPWADTLTTPWTGVDAFGDGSLLYNGADGPISTMRLEELSDGIDDFEYLTIAENLFGRAYVDEKIAKVTHTLTDYTLDDSLLARVRVEIGNDIENAMQK